MCGCPVVAVDVGDMSEWMDVYSQEVNELADAVEKRLSQGQEVTLPENFSFESVRDQWSSLLDSI